MCVEVTRKKDGSLSSNWWYGRFKINGKSRCVNLGVKVKGRAPKTLKQVGDTAFERSRIKAQLKLEELKSETPSQKAADATVETLLRTVPATVPGIVFLSGGQSSELASARLNAMNIRFQVHAPWALAFSFARAIQQPALEIWRGDAANVPAAQPALRHRAQCNRAARRREYSAAMEH